MNLIKMSYKGVEMEVNPTTLEINFAKSISTKHIPFASAKTQEINIAPTKICGNGRLAGSGAKEQAYQLEKLFKSRGSAYLFIPNASPIKAFFSSLKMSLDSRDNSFIYSFEFTEDSHGKDDKFDFGYTYAQSGENLYDIANRTGVDVGFLFEKNGFKDLFAVKAGDKVWLS